MTKQIRSHKSEKKEREKSSFYDDWNDLFKRNTYRFLSAALVIGLIAGILSFDVKPSPDGDDTSYVLQAMKIVTTGQIPVGFRTPGYPLMLSLVIWIFGTNLLVLKATSLLSFLGIIASLFFVFRDRLKPIVVIPTMLLVAINPLMLKYSHLTFSEIFFALLLIWAVHFTLRTVETDSIYSVLIAATLGMASFYIRIAGVTLVAAAIFFFVLNRRWRSAAIFATASLVLYSPIKIYEWISGTEAFGQASILLLKNPYNSTLGMETLGGFIERFINNSINHLNYQIPFAIGIPMPSEMGLATGNILNFPNSRGIETFNVFALIGIAVSIITLTGLIFPVIKNKAGTTSLVGIFLLFYIAFISIALQNLFATPRMLVPIIPFLIFGLFEGCLWVGNRLAKIKDTDTTTVPAKKLIVMAIICLVFTNFISTAQDVNANYPILKANLAGNELAGFSEDWVNYLRASMWIKKNLPVESTHVICRKPELFLLYAGNYDVYGTYKIDETNPDSLVQKWKSMNMTHLLYDNFQWTSTLQRYVQPVAAKYPQMFELIYQEGRQQPSFVFRLNYSAVNSGIIKK